MEILNAMVLVCGVHGERHAVQTLVAHHTAEATRMVWLARRTQNALQNRLHANRTLFQRVQVVLLAARLAVERVERLSLQVDLALATREARYVVDLLHGRASRRLAHHSLAALHASA